MNLIELSRRIAIPDYLMAGSSNLALFPAYAGAARAALSAPLPFTYEGMAQRRVTVEIVYRP